MQLNTFVDPETKPGKLVDHAAGEKAVPCVITIEPDLTTLAERQSTVETIAMFIQVGAADTDMRPSRLSNVSETVDREPAPNKFTIQSEQWRCLHKRE
jgi:hypothetical protein